MRALVVAALVLASSTAAVADKLPTVPATYIEDQLAQQVQRMIDAGHLAPGLAYVADHYCFDALPDGKSGSYYQFDDYWHNPAETIYTLLRALPHVPAAMRGPLKAYIQREWKEYPPYEYTSTDWGGASRDIFLIAPEMQEYYAGKGGRTAQKPSGQPAAGWTAWSLPPVQLLCLLAVCPGVWRGRRGPRPHLEPTSAPARR